MKFRDRELPAPPLENNSSRESTANKTSMETTTRKSSVETTSKTTSETVKKMQVLPPHLMSPHNLRANGRLPSCLEVQKEFFLKLIFVQVSGQPWYKPVDRKTAEEMVRKGDLGKKYLHFLILFKLQLDKTVVSSSAIVATEAQIARSL